MMLRSSGQSLRQKGGNQRGEMSDLTEGRFGVLDSVRGGDGRKYLVILCPSCTISLVRCESGSSECAPVWNTNPGNIAALSLRIASLVATGSPALISPPLVVFPSISRNWFSTKCKLSLIFLSARLSALKLYCSLLSARSLALCSTRVLCSSRASLCRSSCALSVISARFYAMRTHWELLIESCARCRASQRSHDTLGTGPIFFTPTLIRFLHTFRFSLPYTHTRCSSLSCSRSRCPRYSLSPAETSTPISGKRPRPTPVRRVPPSTRSVSLSLLSHRSPFRRSPNWATQTLLSHSTSLFLYGLLRTELTALHYSEPWYPPSIRPKHFPRRIHCRAEK